MEAKKLFRRLQIASLTIATCYLAMVGTAGSTDAATSEAVASPIKGGRLVAMFNSGGTQGKRHDGIDIAAPVGSAVHAYATGTVAEVGQRKGCGRFVRIDHGQTIRTLYCNVADILVGPGENVQKDQPIASIAIPEAGVPSHLHFELERQGKKVDPAPSVPGY